MNNRVTKKRVLVTGGAGFIGSNLVDDFLLHDNFVVCLDDFSTGKRENIAHLNDHPNFLLVEGDIRNLDDCKKACAGVDIVLHHAALGSVPRSMEDPITTNEVNISGFLNMLVAARDASVKRFVYACSSSTYGDSTALPKVEDKIGKPLSPYAITKYVNELYADVFANLYAMQLIGLRYFNIFGRRQDPFSTYSAVIPKFVSALINYKPITINGDGSFSRDFTYIENVVLANHLAATTQNPEAINQVYNVACGERTTLNQMVEALIEFMSEYDPKIKNAEVI
ncbi:MAG: NAD-dependent epimerase/dehydratase family protein, partial [Bacteroidales bacterium]|nr:NAD-dependent epimerase/dehydratase family protein [Bacteroidales bacterium]